MHNQLHLQLQLTHLFAVSKHLQIIWSPARKVQSLFRASSSNSCANSIIQHALQSQCLQIQSACHFCAHFHLYMWYSMLFVWPVLLLRNLVLLQVPQKKRPGKWIRCGKHCLKQHGCSKPKIKQQRAISWEIETNWSSKSDARDAICWEGVRY